MTLEDISPILIGMKTILIVEDDEELRQCLMFAIQTSEINIRMASDGVEAWEIINSEEIDLVITDYRMPKMDGATLSKLINQKFPEIPIILISTYEPRDLKIDDIIDSFLSKPFDPDILKMKVEAILKIPLFK